MNQGTVIICTITKRFACQEKKSYNVHSFPGQVPAVVFIQLAVLEPWHLFALFLVQCCDAQEHVLFFYNTVTGLCAGLLTLFSGAFMM